jgi:two-component system response regulator
MSQNLLQSRKQILLVEDHPGECELFARAFAQQEPGGTLAIQPGVEAALQFLQERAQAQESQLPQLILLDLKLADGTGLDLLRQLRTDPNLAFVPVVILTTSDDPNDIRTCYAAGANGYVRKPDTLAELMALTADLYRYWLRWNQCLSVNPDRKEA